MIVNAYKTKKNLVAVHNGKGKILFCRPFKKENFNTKIDFIDYVEIPPGTSIGLHKHRTDEEVYFIVKGEGLMFLNGEKIPVTEGDIIVNKSWGEHGFLNNSNKIVCIFVFQVLL